jgi:agmatinase
MEAAVDSGFLDLPEDLSDARRAAVHVLPVPYEATVSYESGTRDGPAAIIAASHAVEFYDPELDAEPCLTWGAHTLPAMDATWPEPGQMMDAVAAAAERVARDGKLLVALGGEHSISAAIVRGVRRVIGEPLVVVQIDAHADLRESFQGSAFSHACAMRRVLDENPGPIIQLGIRSYCAEEAAFIRGNRGHITQWPADLIHAEDPREFLRQLRTSLTGRAIYLTIDVDGLDPSVVPATGTPEPGGLTWRQACDILACVAGAGRVVAMDCVELAPRPGLHAADFSVAKLLYKTISWIMHGRAAAQRGTS